MYFASSISGTVCALTLYASQNTIRKARGMSLNLFYNDLSVKGLNDFLSYSTSIATVKSSKSPSYTVAASVIVESTSSWCRICLSQ